MLDQAVEQIGVALLEGGGGGPRASVFASSLISVAKNRARPGVIEARRKLDRLWRQTELVALILNYIRGEACGKVASPNVLPRLL